jgi:hypothetical protein
LCLFAAFPLFLSCVSLHSFNVSDIHIGGGLLQTPVDKLFGRFMERIPQLSFGFRQHVLFRPLILFPSAGSLLTFRLSPLDLRQFFIPQPVKGTDFSSGDEKGLPVFAKRADGGNFSRIDSDEGARFIRFCLLSIFILHGQIKTLIQAAFNFFDRSLWQMQRILDNWLFPFSMMNAHGEFDFSVFIHFETIFHPFCWEMLLFLVGIAGRMSLLDCVVCEVLAKRYLWQTACIDWL